MCGGSSVDCSCDPSCTAQGNCCSDYQNCETLLFANQNRQQECSSKVSNCSMCSFPINGKVECAQCNPGFFLRSGECVDNCFVSDKVVSPNKICLKNQDCRVENCAECIDNNPAVCKSCYNGFFMMNNQCLVSCPGIYRADRISWACLEAPVFAWYWVFPSIGSCSSRCGASMSHELDCSCSQDCFRYGNCCQDVEDYCPELVFWK
jgi:proprotein convertase subtilisin/kexin type 5